MYFFIFVCVYSAIQGILDSDVRFISVTSSSIRNIFCVISCRVVLREFFFQGNIIRTKKEINSVMKRIVYKIIQKHLLVSRIFFSNIRLRIEFVEINVESLFVMS